MAAAEPAVDVVQPTPNVVVKLEWANAATPGIGAAVRLLLGQLDPKHVRSTPELQVMAMTSFLTRDCSRLAVARLSGYHDDLIVGMAAMSVVPTLTDNRLGAIHHIIVDQPSRRQGIGGQLLQYLLDQVEIEGGGRVSATIKALPRSPAAEFFKASGFASIRGRSFGTSVGIGSKK